IPAKEERRDDSRSWIARASDPPVHLPKTTRGGARLPLVFAVDFSEPCGRGGLCLDDLRASPGDVAAGEATGGVTVEVHESLTRRPGLQERAHRLCVRGAEHDLLP